MIDTIWKQPPPKQPRVRPDDILPEGNSAHNCRHCDCNGYDPKMGNHCSILKDTSEQAILNQYDEPIAWIRCPFYRKATPEEIAAREKWAS